MQTLWEHKPQQTTACWIFTVPMLAARESVLIGTVWTWSTVQQARNNRCPALTYFAARMLQTHPTSRAWCTDHYTFSLIQHHEPGVLTTIHSHPTSRAWCTDYYTFSLIQHYEPGVLTTIQLTSQFCNVWDYLASSLEKPPPRTLHWMISLATGSVPPGQWSSQYEEICKSHFWGITSDGQTHISTIYLFQCPPPLEGDKNCLLNL